MKLLSRDFTLREKILLLVLSLFLIGLMYYQFVEVPVTTALERAETQKADLELELGVVNSKVASLTRMQKELDAIIGNSKVKPMPSYNNHKEEVTFLDGVLEGKVRYSIAFQDAARQGNQVRRTFSLSFIAPNYATAQAVVAELSGSPMRCVISSVQFNSRDILTTMDEGQVSVNLSATFFETMVGGTEDQGLKH